jgi:Uma2 family endonuclease
MAFTLGDRPVRPLTADEVLRMVDAGILGEDERVELLHGVLTAVSPKSPQHVAVKLRLVRWLSSLDGDRYVVRTEDPLAVPDRTSLPEPDIAVVHRDDTTIAHPAAALLVVEIAASSLRTDTQVKPALYAAAGVPELWVVDVPGREVRVLREPAAGGYAAERRAGRAEALQALRVPAPPLALEDVFAGL